MTTTKAKPTPQGISALLRKAGFPRGNHRLHGGVSGFYVSQVRHEPAVQVRYSSVTMGTTNEFRNMQLAKYARVLNLHGYLTEADARMCRLIVTAKPETAPSGAEENHHD